MSIYFDILRSVVYLAIFCLGRLLNRGKGYGFRDPIGTFLPISILSTSDPSLGNVLRTIYCVIYM